MTDTVSDILSFQNTGLLSLTMYFLYHVIAKHWLSVLDWTYVWIIIFKTLSISFKHKQLYRRPDVNPK